MSNDEAEEIGTSLKRKWDNKHKQDFIHRMNRKMQNREMGGARY